MSENKSGVDLSLVSLEELVAEASNRCDAFIAAYTLPDRPNEACSFYGNGSYIESAGLASCLKNDILNNFCHEREKLEELIEAHDLDDEDDEDDDE